MRSTRLLFCALATLIGVASTPAPAAAQIAVALLEADNPGWSDDVRDKLRAMAASNGRSMEEEVREILRAAALADHSTEEKGLGTRIAERFQKYRLKEGEEIEEIRGQPAKPADFDT